MGLEKFAWELRQLTLLFLGLFWANSSASFVAVVLSAFLLRLVLLICLCFRTSGPTLPPHHSNLCQTLIMDKQTKKVLFVDY